MLLYISVFLFGVSFGIRWQQISGDRDWRHKAYSLRSEPPIIKNNTFVE